MSAADVERYNAALHAMQSGVAVEMNYDTEPTEPKHLRVGINSAMCQHTGLVRLLIAKGLITVEEYEVEMADEMQREVARYEEQLSRRGTNVTLA